MQLCHASAVINCACACMHPYLVKLKLECWTVAGEAGHAAALVVPVLDESEASRICLLLLSLSD